MQQRIYATVRPVSGLRYYEAETVRMYTVIDHVKVRMLPLGEAWDLPGLPPTARCESTQADGLYTHRITYRISQPTAGMLAGYIRLGAMDGVVLYRDWSGRERVIGSPSYPARLSIADDGSGATVTIEAKSRHPALLYEAMI